MKFYALNLCWAVMVLAAGLPFATAPALSQDAPAQVRQITAETKTFRTRARAADATRLVAGQTQIRLWGLEGAGQTAPQLDMKARNALDGAIGQAAVECDLKSRSDNVITAQCKSANDLDLGLMILQQGFATADRAAVFGSAFEETYIRAEADAQNRGLGVWAGHESDTAVQEGNSLYTSLAFILFLVVVGAFVFLSIVIMRGFQKVIQAQNDNLEMMAKERQLRQKERGIIAAMLDTEIKNNKAKIEAYLVVYEETLKSLKDTSREPKYKKAGDIVQSQPSLDRSVFDRNTDKLDILGRRLASDLIHFYARVRSKSEYINLEPDTDYTEAVSILEKAVDNARGLNEMAAGLLEEFEVRGVAEEAKV